MFGSLTIENRDVPSAKRLIWDLMPFSKSFILIKKSKGPNTEPWGTPDSILPNSVSEP